MQGLACKIIGCDQDKVQTGIRSDPHPVPAMKDLEEKSIKDLCVDKAQFTGIIPGF